MKFKPSTKEILILSSFIAYTLFLFFNFQNISSYMANAPLYLALLVYVIFNPAYLLIIYGLWTRFKNRKPWKRIIAIVVGIFSLDFLAVPRLSMSDALTDGPAISSNIGSIVMKALETIFPHNVSYFLMYIVIPLAGLAIAVELLGITDFMKEMR